MEDLKIKYDGQSHQIEANTLINSLLHFTTVVQEINKSLNTNKKVEVKINALPEGSFLVHFTLEATSLLKQAINLFASNPVTALMNLVAITTSVYNLAKFLKGKKPKSISSEGDKTTIINEFGDKIIIDNLTVNIYLSNNKIREAITQEFSTLENDPNVTGLEILDKDDKVIVQIEREEFPALAGGYDYIETPEDKVISKTGMLNILRLSFDRNQKWEFYYEGNKISAKINEDDDFLKRIDNGEQFAKGDSLEVELEIRQEFDESVDTFVNKAYRISKIVKHIPRSKQHNLFEGTSE